MTEIKTISIRGRVAYSILCLEKLMVHKKYELLEYDFVLSKLWSYTFINLGKWHYEMAEITPRAIEEDIPFKEKGCDYIKDTEHDYLLEIYKKTDNSIKDIIYLIFQIGTLDLYASIIDNSRRTIELVMKIEDVLKRNHVALPDINLLKKFRIEINQGFGKAFIKEDIFDG